MKAALSVVIGLSLGCLSCRARDCDETRKATADASTSSPISDEDDEAELRALCGLGMIHTPPGQQPGGAREVAVIGTKTGRRLGWVQLTGVATNMAPKVKPEDASWHFTLLDSSRTHGHVATICARYRNDKERKVLVTETFRTNGDAKKGDYLTYAAVGLGPDSPKGTGTTLTGVSELEAKAAVMKVARDLIGEQALEKRRGLVDDWDKALEASP